LLIRRFRARIAGEVSSGREPADVADATDDDRGGQRADPVDVGDRGRRSRDDRGGAFADIDTGGVEHPDLVQQLGPDCDPLDRDGAVAIDAGQELFSL